MTVPALLAVGRRDLLAATGYGIVAGFGRVGGVARRIRPSDAPWILPESLLRDLPRIMELASVPGLAMAGVEGGAVSWTRSSGVLNATTRMPVQDDSVFPAASLGKPVFGYVVLRLVDEGKLDLDRPLAGYLRPDDLPADPNSDRVTARHVLSHTTGYRNWRGRADTRFVPDAAPGTRFGYSGEGFFWLERVVETITGRGVDRVMRDYLLRAGRDAKEHIRMVGGARCLDRVRT